MIKDIKGILIAGMRLVWKNHKFVYLFWSANIAFGIILTLPLFYILNDNLQHSAMSDSLFFSLDYTWYAQIRNIYKSSIGVYPYLIYSVIGAYTIIQVFFLGGIIAVMHNSAKNHYVDFFFGCVKYFYRFLKILLLSLFFYAVAFKINDYLGQLIEYLFSNQEQRLAEFILRAARYALLIFLIGVVTLVSDYSKISAAVKDNLSIWPEIKNAIRFIRKNFPIVFTVFLIVASLGALGVIVYDLTANYLPKTTYLFFILSFILQQLLIIFRFLIRMYFYASQVFLFKDLNAQIISASAEEIQAGV